LALSARADSANGGENGDQAPRGRHRPFRATGRSLGQRKGS